MARPALPGREVPDDENVKIRVLNVSWNELARDLEARHRVRPEPVVPQSLRGRVRPPGGRAVRRAAGRLRDPAPARRRPSLSTTSRRSGKISRWPRRPSRRSSPASIPSLFGLDSFTELEQPLDLAKTFEQLEYLKWKAFRADGGRALRRPDAAPRPDAAALRGRRRPRGDGSASARTWTARTGAAISGATRSTPSGSC